MALLLASASGAAQQVEERELSPDERARELYLRGDRLYAEGSYDEAIAALKEAYELSRRPALLYDIANALERLGRYEEALHHLNWYAPSAPDHQRHVVLKRIRSLELRAEEQRHQEQGRREQGRPEQGRQEQGREASGREAPVAPAPSAAPPSGGQQRMEPPAPPAPILGYALGGAGVLAIGAGVVLGLSASSAKSDAEEQCAGSGAGVFCPVSAREALSDASGRALAADLAWGLGAVALGVGLYLVLDAESESGATAALRGAATAGGAGVSFVQTF